MLAPFMDITNARHTYFSTLALSECLTPALPDQSDPTKDNFPDYLHSLNYANVT